MKQRANKRQIKEVEVRPLSVWCETTVSDSCSTCAFAKGCQRYGHFLGDKLLKLMKSQGYPDHNTDSPDCWCYPEVIEYDNGNKVIVHNRAE